MSNKVNYKIDFPVDAREAAVIARRRRDEEERKLRIFNPRERMIGKDLRALQEQIIEKQERQTREKELEEAWTREMNRQQMLILELQRRAEQDKKKVWQEVQEFRKECQRFEDRREFDLNDKRKCGYPARLHDEDPRCGPASMQKFEGEDLSHKGRLVNQEQQKKFWLEAQMAEKRQNQKEFEEANRLYEQRLQEMSKRAVELSKAEEKAKKAVDHACREYNLCLAKENEERKKLMKLADEEATLAHQLNMFHSELLSEVTDVTSCNGPFRVGKDRFKGYSEEMIKTIKEEQLRQAMDKRRREAGERMEDAAWEKMRKRYAIATSILDKELDSRKKDQKMELSNINKELGEQHRMRQEIMNNMVYKGTITEGFFDQFNTSTR